MKRRETFSLLPMTLAGLSSLTGNTFAGEKPSKEYHLKPIDSLALRYVDAIKEMLFKIRDTQSANLLEGAYVIARAVKNRGKCWSFWDVGHNTRYDFAAERNGIPEIFTNGYNVKESKKGDVFLTAATSLDLLKDAVDKGVFIIGSTSAYSLDGKGDDEFRDNIQDYRFKPYANLWIEQNINRKGAIMNIPGSKFPMGPVSGILGMTTFWMMMSDACRILARDSISAQVRGDEPKITKLDEHDWELNHIMSLDRPLMNIYFDRIIEEMDLITAELGTIRRIAGMVIDSVLSGGRVYCYSRFRNQIAVEGNTRRGGLALFNGVFDGDDKKEFSFVSTSYDIPFTEKDCVIMGFTKPDDPVDLENFDKFRKIGMKIASIGPQSRNYLIPEGRTIPKESDAHLGAMADTYGIFALPGFDKKVCPTSGAINNQLFWATCMEIVEQFRERTGGNVPGIHANVAIRSGRRNMRWNLQLYNVRGY